MTGLGSVLIVEDDVWQAEHFKRELEKQNFSVSVAGNAEEAVYMVDDLKPSVVVLDLMLPGTNGIAMLHELRSYTDTATIPVILCSSMASNVSQDQLKAYGVSDVIDKTTIQPNELVAAIKKCLL